MMMCRLREAAARVRRADVPAARRIVDNIALAVSHDNWPKRHSKSQKPAHADQLEARGTAHTELESKSHLRVVGVSREWRDVLKRRRRSRERYYVLLIGESALGRKSSRDSFIALAAERGSVCRLDCAALPEQLLESELFGTSRGFYRRASDQTRVRSSWPPGGVCSSTKSAR